MTTPRATAGEFTGRHMLALMLAFFGVIVSVNVGMAVLSATSWTGLVVTNTYVASQEFEGKRLAHLAQQGAGWQTDLTVTDGFVTISVRDAAGRPVDLGPATLKISRPVGGHDDQVLDLVAAPDGLYRVPITLAPGAWDADVVAPATALGPFELRRRFSIGATP